MATYSGTIIAASVSKRANGTEFITIIIEADTTATAVTGKTADHARPKDGGDEYTAAGMVGAVATITHTAGAVSAVSA